MKLLKTLLIAVVITFIAITCGSGGGGGDDPATKTTTVSGTVTDKNGAPIQGAEVTITSTPVNKTTDNSGNFSATVEVGDHHISIKVGEVEIYSIDFNCTAEPYSFATIPTQYDPNDSYPDADGDGHENNRDCDDNNANVYPGATEIYGDSIDQDCSGSDLDFPYTDNDNGTVTDNVTNLMWQQEDDNQEYNWYEASGTNDASINSGTTDVCGSMTLAGYSDWRLPNIKELRSIVVNNTSVHVPAIDTTYFPNTSILQSYWSSTTHVLGPTGAWAMNFYGGSAGNYNKASNGLYVRCVRGGQ